MSSYRPLVALRSIVSAERRKETDYPRGAISINVPIEPDCRFVKDPRNRDRFASSSSQNWA